MAASIYSFKPPYADGSVPSLSGHAIAYRWRSLPRVYRHRASKPQGSFKRVMPWQVTVDQLTCTSLSHTYYWYEVGMLKVPANTTYRLKPICPSEIPFAVCLGAESALRGILKYSVQRFYSSRHHTRFVPAKSRTFLELSSLPQNGHIELKIAYLPSPVILLFGFFFPLAFVEKYITVNQLLRDDVFRLHHFPACAFRELKWLRSVDPAKADRAAVKALAHAKINN